MLLLVLGSSLVTAFLPPASSAHYPGLLVRRHTVACCSEAPAGKPEKVKRKLPKRAGKAKRSERLARPSGKGFGAADGLKFDRRSKDGSICGCASGLTYGACCKALHEGAPAQDVMSLLRARYTAFSYRLPDYLIDTTSRSGSEWRDDYVAWKKEVMSFCDQFCFEGLTVEGEPEVDGNTATITFSVHLVQKGSIKMMDSREKSTFVRGETGWLYQGGEVDYA
mmetsp:Transcript_12012/g.25957  ORF Transcript_12012/g.25957 Transcript_12012/m.25957 type:complete len:223 (-) Transcript_12012:448-1116(-)|eukprot:CAMPEP_0183358550 /NCGR_PEP_ID=MMETSP0164_2-20130417/49613_1 /TAXON_ID=221442 /ORGANISM="Coccolithus pelagicus ssp braarudi, Strain PLY182g" /LENGTH=222 /DNA_ID=CAMNT_0025532471 /DNA_START=24 /DNA_END=692 /DNA_ORIENTATION=+